MRHHLRDTARDIIFGTRLSATPRIQQDRRNKEAMSGENPNFMANQKRMIGQLQAQIEELRSQQEQMEANNEQSRRRVEAAQGALMRRLEKAEASAMNIRDLSEMRRQFAIMENRLGILGQEMLAMRANLEKQIAEMRAMGAEIRARPVLDPMKIATSSQAMEMRVRDLQAQMVQLRHNAERELADRVRANQAQNDIIGKLQEFVRQQDLHKADQLQTMQRQMDAERARMAEEMKRMGERVQAMGQEWQRGHAEREARLREELAQRHSTLQSALNAKLESRAEWERELLRKSEERWRSQQKMVEEMRRTVQEERLRHREHFEKVNEALMALERHLEGGHRKMDRVMSAELESRKMHEKALLSKMVEAESQLNNQLGELAKSVADVRAGLADIRIPVLDTEGLRRDIEAIAEDRNKLSMEGLLRLEERVSRMQNALAHERGELLRSLSQTLDEEMNAKLRVQIGKMDQMVADITRAQAELRQQVEQRIPENMEELSAKLENVKLQLVNRIDQEEEERYLAIRELQDAYGRLATSGIGGGTGGQVADGLVSSASLKRDVEECRVAIRKLAESLTTVKNVLDRKVMDEVRRREQDVEVLNSRIDTATVHALQSQ